MSQCPSREVVRVLLFAAALLDEHVTGFFCYSNAVYDILDSTLANIMAFQYSSNLYLEFFLSFVVLFISSGLSAGLYYAGRKALFDRNIDTIVCFGPYYIRAIDLGRTTVRHLQFSTIPRSEIGALKYRFAAKRSEAVTGRLNA